jgi:hypothetical protein
MAVKRSYNALNQVRVSVPDMKGIESAVRSDFDDLLSGLITGAGNPQIVRGFEIEMAGSIGSSANSLQVIVENSSILHGSSATAGTFFVVPAGTASQTLSSTANTRVIGSFTPSSLNFVGIDYNRQPANSTATQRYFWSPATQSEFVRTAPQAELLDFRLVISVSSFTSNQNILPLAVVETDGANNVLLVEDRRPLLFRLGRAGAASPDPTYEYGWNNHLEGRSENPSSSSSSTISPFRGGDKQILSMKEMFDSLMTEIKLIKGTPFWYNLSSGGSIAKLRTDLGNTIITSKGAVAHNAAIAGKLNWTQDINLVVIGSRIKYKILANPSSNYIILDDNEVAYVTLVRDVPIIPNLIFTNGSTVVNSVGAISWTTDLQAGDFIKDASGAEDKYYEIANIDTASQVTLTINYQEPSTGIGGIKSTYAWGTYEVVQAPSTNRHVKIGNRNDIQINQNNYWLFARQDGGALGAEQTQITTLADVSGDLNNKSFKLSSNDSIRRYRFLFDNGFTFVTPDPDEILVKIPLINNSDENQIAEVMRDIIDEQTDFSASGVGNSVEVTNALFGASAVGEDVDTGFAFSQTFAGAKAKVYARFFGSEVEQGETRQISDNESFELMNYMGARSETDSSPTYSSAFEQITTLSFKISLPAASAIDSGNSFVLFSVTDNEAFRFWFNKDGAGGIPSAPGETMVEVNISTGFTNLQVATATVAQLSVFSDFNVLDNSDGSLTVTLSSGGRTSLPFNVDVAGLSVTVLTYGSGEQNYYLQDGENLTKAIKRLDVSVQGIIKAFSNEAYEEEYEIVAGSPSNIYQITGPLVANSQLVLPLNSVKNFAATGYKVGSNQLEIFLNGQMLRQGRDWNEFGGVGSESIIVEFLFQLEVSDLILFRIDTGTLGPIAAGSTGGAASIYDRSLYVVETPVNPEEIGSVLAGTPISLPLGKTYVGDELQVYLSGQFVEEGIDYLSISSSEIEFLYDISPTDIIRFRIDSGGGAGGGGQGGLQINSGEANTASNLGMAGAGVFKTKVGADLQFKRLIEGAGVTIFEGVNTIAISSAPTAPIKNVVTFNGVGGNITTSNDYVRALNSGNDTTLTLPSAVNAGKEIIIKKMDSGNVLSIATFGGETIDGINATATPLIITVQYESISLIANGASGWEIV